MSAALEIIKSTLATGGDHLGDMLWWALADARIDRNTLETTWIGAGLPPGLLPAPPTADRAFKIAIRETRVGQHDRLLRLGKEDGAEVIFAIVQERRLGDGSVDFTQEARITLDRSREVVTSDQPGHELVTAVQGRFRELLRSHTADDVRRTIVRALAFMAAVTLRDNGGVYWVPVSYAQQVRRLEKALCGIGASRLFIVPVHRSREAEKALGDVAKASIEQELVALRNEIRGFLEAPPDRASTLERRLESFEGLKARAGLYQTILKTEVDGLDAELARLATSVESMLQQKTAA